MERGGDAESFVNKFAAGWRSGSLESFLDSFAPLVDPDVRLIQPPLPTQRGWDGFVRLFTSLYELMPDLRGEVVGWEPTEDGWRSTSISSAPWPASRCGCARTTRSRFARD